MAGILSKNIKLGYKNASATTYTNLAGLQEIPDLGAGTPDTVEVTTLADGQRKYITGLKDIGDSISFTFLYDEAVFSTINAMNGVRDWVVIIPDGEGSTSDTPVYKTSFKFSGEASATLSGVGVGDALTFTVDITPNSDIVIGTDGDTAFGD